jgi:tetratricopeptide (TPR) repeat protein
VESVAWITERKDMLSTLFFMLALCAYVAYVSKPKRSRYLSIVVLFGLGLMAKPMVVTLPFVLLLLDVWPLQRLPLNDARRSAARLVREKLPLFALAAASSITTYFAQQTTGAVVALDAIPLRIRLANALVSYFAYIGKMFWPTRLVLFYPYPLEIPTWWVIGSVVGLIGMSALVIRSARRHPYLLVGWLWYVGTLVPVIGFVQAGTQSMADRFTYIPLIGLFIMVAWAIPDLLGGWPHAKIPLAAAAVLALGGCAIMASVQVRYWKDGFSLWEHALDVTSRNYIAHTNLGIAFSEAGKHNEAVAQYSDALRIKPDLADARNDLGVALANQGRTADAVHEFEEALRIKPDQAASHYNAGVLLRQMGNTTEALRHFEAALALDPNYQDARREYDSLRRRISAK